MTAGERDQQKADEKVGTTTSEGSELEHVLRPVKTSRRILHIDSRDSRSRPGSRCET